MSTEEDVIIDIRSLILSIPGQTPISLLQIQKDYFELYGSIIPYKQFNYENLEKFLKEWPERIKVFKDQNGHTLVKAHLTNETANLSKLVQEQKKSRKRSNNKNKFNKNKENSYMTKKSIQSIRKMVKKAEDSYQKFNSKRLTKSQSFTKQPKQLKSTNESEFNPWIENAAYFLNGNNEIQILNLLGKDEICFKIISDSFPFKAKFDEMNEKMNKFYQNLNKSKQNIVQFEIDKLYVAYFKPRNAYFRVTIIKILKHEVVCCFVDDGFEHLVQKSDIFPIDNEYKMIKYQTITAKLDKFNDFINNNYLENILFTFLYDQIFKAKKSMTNPLSLTLLDKNGDSINDYLAKKYSYFIDFKPEQNKIYQAMIAYHDEASQTSFIHLKERQHIKKIDEIMLNLYEFFESQSSNTSTSVSQIDTNRIYCTKWLKDNNYYRVCILGVNNDTANIEYIDFGNRETINITNLKEIPALFQEYLYLPPLVVPAKVLRVINSTLKVNEMFVETLPIEIKFKSLKNPYEIAVKVVHKTAELSINDEKEVTSDESDSETASTITDDGDLSEKLSRTMQIASNRASIVITYVTNPSNFYYCLTGNIPKCQRLYQEMTEFYSNNVKIKQAEAQIGQVYIHRGKDGSCNRVKIEQKMNLVMFKAFNIDIGNFCFPFSNELYSIEDKFAKISPMAVQGGISLGRDLKDCWSDSIVKYFKDVVKIGNEYEALIESSSVDLIIDNSSLMSQLILAKIQSIKTKLI